MSNGVGAADWSPDGTQLLLLAGSGEKRFLVGKEDDPTARRIRDYTWRMDGAGIRDEHTSVWIADLAGAKPVRLTPPTYHVAAAAWSPDGKHLAVHADLPGHRGHSHPFRFGVDGTVEELAEPTAVCFAMAAGGGRVAVVASTDEPSDVYAVENGELRRLTNAGSRWYGPFHRSTERLSIKHP